MTTEIKDVGIIKSRKWIRDNTEQNNTRFHVIYQGKMDFEYRNGNPFIACYCRKSAILYCNPQVKEFKDSDWKSFKKKINKYQEGYYHDRDTLLAEAGRFRELDSLTGVFLTYFFFLIKNCTLKKEYVPSEFMLLFNKSNKLLLIKYFIDPTYGDVKNPIFEPILKNWSHSTLTKR